ncbi:MAG: matrixin family metalloprotease [Verrucomicrobia bacterium]|nr:matrixin family metalloprotease [Verrucomicrobiota bacterium]
MTRKAWMAIAWVCGCAAVVRAWVPLGGALRPDGPVAITVALTETAPVGTAGDLNAAAREAMNLWNAKLQRVRLAPAAPEGEVWYENGRSELFFDQNMFDESFPSGVLAVTSTTEDRGVVVETDIIFNANRRWSVYQGGVQSAAVDARRVAAHELGHLLGLDHPDEAGQRVAAIMNSTISAVEVPSADDEAGVRALYDFGPGAPPVIIAHPEPTNVGEGLKVNLAATAGGRGPLSYQWTRNGTAIAEATRNKLQFVGEFETAGDYAVIARSPAGATASRAARVTVRPMEALVAGVASSQSSAVMGATLTLTPFLSSAGGFETRFEWSKDGVVIPGATTLRLTVPDVQFSDAGRYVLKVISGAASTEVPFPPVTVTPPSPPRFTSDLESRAVAIDETVTLQAPGTASAPVSYQWKKNGVALPGATTPVLRLSFFQAADAGTYSVTMTNALGQATSEGGVLTLAKAGEVQFKLQPRAVTEYNGATVSFDALVETGVTTFRWWKDGVALNDTPVAPPSPGSPSKVGRISGTREKVLRIEGVSAADAGSYLLEISDGNETVRSRAARLTVLPRPKPVITGNPSHHTVAPGAAVSLGVGVRRRLEAGSIVTPPAYEEPSYQWFKDGVAIAGATMNVLAFTAAVTDTGRYFVRVSNPDAAADSDSAEVTVAAGATTFIPVQKGNIYLDRTYSEGIRFFRIGLDLELRTLSRTVDAVSWIQVGPSPAGNGPVPDSPGFSPGVYRLYAQRGAVIEQSRPAIFDYSPIIVPLITQHPRGNVVVPGTDVSLTADAVAYGPISYQWQKDGVALPGATGKELLLPRVSPNEFGAYRAVCTSSAGSTTTEAAIVEARSSALPVITLQPRGLTATTGTTVTLSVAATGSGLRYQWRKDGQPVSGATLTSLALKPAAISDTGAYTVVVSDGALSTTSRIAQVRVQTPTRAPEMLLQPAAQTVAALGGDATLSAVADGAPLPARYQWRKDGVDIPGATDARLRLSDVTVSSAGAYSVAVTNEAGATTSQVGIVTVDTSARLVNLATRAAVGREGDVLIAGFVVSGTESRQVLVRGIGDQLSEFGVSGVLRDPVVSLYDAKGKLLDSNDDWFRTGEAKMEELRAAAKQVGAFAQREDARDGALLATLAPGSYTVKVAGLANTTGVGLVEVYELGKPGKGRLINLSSRAVVGKGANILIPGLVLKGLTSRRLLIRAVGPGLADFGVAGTLVDPVMTVFRDGAEVAQNDNWGEQANAANVALIRTAMAAVGAFALKEGSRDAALLLDLPPGSYTVQVAGVRDATGVALVEVYEVAP